MKNQEKCCAPQIRFKGFSGNWTREQFGDCVLIQRGGSPRPIEAYLTDEENGVNWVKIGDVKVGSRYITKTEEKIKPEGVSKSRRVFRGDLILSNSMSFGRPYLMAVDGCIHDGWLLIRNTKELFDLDFLFQLLSSDSMLDQYRSLASGGVVNNLNSALVQSTYVNYPQKEEQNKIGEFFRVLDSLIFMHQCKHQRLLTVKSAMHEKMFPRSGSSIPEIRFKGFEEEWESSSLGEITENISNNSLSRTRLNYSEGNAKNIHYGDILVKFGEVLDAQRVDVPYINDNDVAQKLSVHALKDGDVVLADAAEDETVGKCTEIQNIGDQVVLAGLHTIALRPLIDFAPGYLGYFFNSNSYHDQLLPIMQGTKVLSISKTSIKDTLIKYPPSLKEQEKISSFFASLDTLVAKHEVQINKLKLLKASLVDKMFV